LIYIHLAFIIKEIEDNIIMAKKQSIHYVNNRDFSTAVLGYCTLLKEAKASNTELPMVSNYVAHCFLKIAEGLSHKSNFIRYTYREEMVMDAVENCLKAIENYNIDAATRTGLPNAFAYFTQISWFAFLRRIAKEKKQQDIKIRYMTNAGVEEFIISNSDDTAAVLMVQSFVNSLKDRIDKVKEKDTEFKIFAVQEKKLAKKIIKESVDSDLMDFME
tara:strand:+ start:4156 stop:4806 length:651 start_codon:yes stop_codon:yes gene_type:complete